MEEVECSDSDSGDEFSDCFDDLPSSTTGTNNSSTLSWLNNRLTSLGIQQQSHITSAIINSSRHLRNESEEAEVDQVRYSVTSQAPSKQLYSENEEAECKVGCSFASQSPSKRTADYTMEELIEGLSRSDPNSRLIKEALIYPHVQAKTALKHILPLDTFMDRLSHLHISTCVGPLETHSSVHNGIVVSCDSDQAGIITQADRVNFRILVSWIRCAYCYQPIQGTKCAWENLWC